MARSAVAARPLFAVPARPSRKRKYDFEAYAFASPALLILLVFIVLPSLWVFWLSLFKWDLVSSKAGFIGLDNYVQLVHDPAWWKSLWQTVYFVLGTVPTGMALALFLAVLLNTALPGRGVIRGAIFSPYVTPIIGTVVIWQWIFHPDYGLFNAALQAIHLPKIPWLITPQWVMPAIIIYTLWQFTGFNMVIFLAGLANIPAEMGEAARVDGATPWQTFWKITWPLLTPTTYFVLLISSISAFKVFNQVYVFTGQGNNGGPDQAGLTIGYYLYTQAFSYFHAGYGAALSVALFLIILILTALQVSGAGSRVFYR